jgi:hypothetical protein
MKKRLLRVMSKHSCPKSHYNWTLKENMIYWFRACTHSESSDQSFFLCKLFLVKILLCKAIQINNLCFNGILRAQTDLGKCVITPPKQRKLYIDFQSQMAESLFCVNSKLVRIEKFCDFPASLQHWHLYWG